MNAEELEAIRESAKRFDAIGEAMSPIYVFELLAHVDEQSGQIATQTKRARFWHDEFQSLRNDLPYGYREGDYNKILEQIATLKSICIQERNRYLVDFIHEYDDVMDCKEEAKKQLAREYPQIAWEEKK